MTIESNLLCIEKDGEDFVHDTIDDFFLAKWFAEKINSKEMSVSEVHDKYWTCKEDRKSGVYERKDTAFQNMIYFLLDMIYDSEDFILKLNEKDPHMAARCIGKSSCKIDTVKEVIDKLAPEVTREGDWGPRKVDMDQAYALESLGETRSPLAFDLIVNFDHWANAWYRESLAKIDCEEAIDVLYKRMTDVTFNLRYGALKPGHKQSILRSLDDNANPDLLSEYLLEKFKDETLWRYHKYCEADSIYDLKDVNEEVGWYIEDWAVKRPDFWKNFDSIQKWFYDLRMGKIRPYMGNPEHNPPSFRQGEDPHPDEILMLMAKKSNPYVAEELLKFLKYDDRSWWGESLKKIAPYINKKSIDILMRQDKIDIEKKIHLDNLIFSEKLKNG